MAITPIYEPPVRHLNPSYMDALLKGFKGAQEAANTVYKPKQLAEALLAAKLKNAHDETINKYLDRSENARIGSSEASSGLSNLKIQQLRNQMQSDQAFNDLLSGKSSSTPSKPLQGMPSKPQGQYGPTVNEGYDNSDRNVSAEGPGIPASLSAKDVFPGRQPAKKQPAYAENISSGMNDQKSQVISEGDPALQKVNDIWDQRPDLRDKLKKRGFEQKQVTKFDSTTGLTSIITTRPNGEVSVKTSESAVPVLTGAVKTLHQNIVGLTPKAIAGIQHIIDIPSPSEPWGFGAIKSGQKSAHNKAVTAAAENYAKANGWPNTKGSIEKAESILQRGSFESDFDYRKRLAGYQDDLRKNVSTSKQILHPGLDNQSTADNNIVIEYTRDSNGRLVPSNK